MYSLKNRLHRNLLITVTLTMLLLLCLLYIGIQSLTKDYVITRLQHDAESVVTAMEVGVDGTWTLPKERMSTVYNRVHSGHYYIVVANGQRIRSRSLFDTEVELPTLLAGDNNCYLDEIYSNQDEQWLACLQQVTKKGQVITIWVAEDIAPLENTLWRFMVFALALVVAVIVLLVFMQYYILQRGFQQLELLQKSIKQMQLGTDDLDREKLPSEILPLVKEIDRLLKQLSQRVQRTRNALGNLAHELKRPLQRHQLQIETQHGELRKENESIQREIQSVIERELKRSRIVGIATPGRQTVIADDLSGLVNVLGNIYANITIKANYSDGLVLPHDRDDMLELLGNLLDNACKHADEKVEVKIEITNPGWKIIIEDDGKGVTADAIWHITDRGVRLDESVKGHGLGLSICKDIVESYGGGLGFETSELGGLKVLIFLPKL